MKVLLINPPYPFEESPSPPFGLMALAAYLVENGVTVKIEDYIVNPYSMDRIQGVLDTFKPDVVGATAVTMTINRSLDILRDYRECNPNIKTVMGGPHVTFDANAILENNPWIDYIVRGEGELSFMELLENIDSPSSMENVKGISYRKHGKVHNNPRRAFIEDINILPFPARHLVELSKYRALGFPVNLMTSRGCPFSCIFCVGSKMVGRRVRYFDVERIVDEFEMLSKMKFKQINVVDDLFTSNKKRCIAICKSIINRGISHPWTAFARVDTVNLELLENLKEAGCTTLCFGIESGNQEILDRVKKKITLEKCRKAVDLCNEVGIDPMTSYILGLPGETPETVRKTMDFAKELSPNYGYHILAPFPGTEVRDKKEEYGMRILTSDWDQYDANRSVADTGAISHQQIDSIVNEFNDGIVRYVKDIQKKLDNGESLSEDERTLYQNIRSFEITRDIIMNRIIEQFIEITNAAPDTAVIELLEKHISRSLKTRDGEVKQELDRLFALNCINVKRSSNETTITWE